MKQEAVFVHIWASESSGDTPLHFCARSGDLYAFQLLLNHVPHADIALQISNESGEDVWSLGWIRNGPFWTRTWQEMGRALVFEAPRAT